MRNSPWSLSIQIDFTSGLATILAGRAVYFSRGYSKSRQLSTSLAPTSFRGSCLVLTRIQLSRRLSQASLGAYLNQASLGGCHSSHAQAASRASPRMYDQNNGRQHLMDYQ